MFEPAIITAGAALLALAIVAATMLHAWSGWLDLKRRELEGHVAPRRDQGSALGAARIEMADLKERIRKLEAIASGVDL